MADQANTLHFPKRHQKGKGSVNRPSEGKIKSAVRAYRAIRDHARLFNAVALVLPSSREDAMAGIEFVIEELQQVTCQLEHVVLLQNCYAFLKREA